MLVLKILLVLICLALSSLACYLLVSFIKKIVKNQIDFSLQQRWYTKIGKKVKKLAMWIFLIDAILSIILGVFAFISFLIMAISEDVIWIVLAFLVPVAVIIFVILAFISSWILYAFGELVDNSQIIAKKLEPEGFAEDNKEDLKEDNKEEFKEKNNKFDYVCPSCDMVVKYQTEICPNCGQKLDWE